MNKIMQVDNLLIFGSWYVCHTIYVFYE